MFMFNLFFAFVMSAFLERILAIQGISSSFRWGTFFFLWFFFFFETGSLYVTGVELVIFLPQPPRYQYRDNQLCSYMELKIFASLKNIIILTYCLRLHCFWINTEYVFSSSIPAGSFSNGL